ncbi:MAG TPA: hypothetical protein VJ927_11005 [Actinomycetota bacterium]|nr:hypothetical protein [Actinomycetota bacterium]
MTHSERELETIRRLRVELETRHSAPGERALERMQHENEQEIRLDERADILYEFEWAF